MTDTDNKGALLSAGLGDGKFTQPKEEFINLCVCVIALLGEEGKGLSGG